MTSIFDIPELLLNVLSFVKEDRFAFVRCLSVTKAWREVVIENAQQLLDDRVYALCQGATVKVGCSEEKNFEFRVPGYQTLLLVIAGAIEVADDKLVFRSRDIAERWFRTARRYVDKELQKRSQPLTIVDWPDIERTKTFAGGRLMAPIVRPKTGQLWFCVNDTHKNKSFAEVREELLKAFKSTEPHVVVGASGLGLVGFDGRDRLWFKLGMGEVLHGLREHEYVTLNSKTRTEAGLPELKQSTQYIYKEFFHTGESNGSESICALDHENRFYVSDSIGVHIIHPDSPNHFDYHSTYRINYEKNIFYEKSECFASLHKYVDVTGKLFVWSTSGIFGRSGTVGYWTYDGKQWKNVDMGHYKVYDLVVRVLKDKRQIWVFSAREIKIFEEPLCGDAAPMPVPLIELAGAVDPYNNRVVARSADHHDSVVFIGTKTFLLDSKHKQREPLQLPDKIHSLLTAIDLGKSAWGNNTIMDGVMYFSDDTKIVAASLDGKTVTNYSSTETLSGPRVHYVVKKARKYGKPVTLIYLRGGNLTYLLDTTVKFVDFSGMPGMFVNNLRDRPSAPNPEGHLYFYAQTENKLYQWKANQLPQVQSGEIVNTNNDVVFGNDDIMITRDNYKTFMYQNGKILTAKGLEELVDQHYETLVKLLPYPPHRASLQYGTNFNVIHDGLGNLWIGDREKLSVRTPTGFIHFHTSPYYPDVKNKYEVRVSAIAPLGNGSAVVLIDKHEGLVLKIKEQSFEVESTPIGVKHSVYAYDWKENVFYDKRGEVYVISEEWSMDYQANGMHFKTYPLLKSPMIALRGKLLLIDRHSGKWFYQERINANIPSTLIYRPDQGNAEFKLEISLKVQLANEDFMTDHSVWLHVDSGLTRVKFNGEALEITEQLKMVVPSSTRTSLSNGRYVLWGREYNSCSCFALEEKSFK